MTLTLRLACDQDDFDAQEEGSCEGISFVFCMLALQQANPVSALQSMLDQRKKIALLVEEIMKEQDEVLDKASERYSRDSFGEPITGLGSHKGFLTENVAIQARHDWAKQKSRIWGNRCIGTLSSFFEGSVGGLIQRFLSLGSKAGLAAGHVGLQGEDGHAVAVFWSNKKENPYFFDPNDGVYEAAASSLSSDLTQRFEEFSYIYSHVFKRAT